MSSLGQLLKGDLEVGILLLKCDQALDTLFASHSDRKHELHVSDFTRNDKNFCAPSLVVRFLRGDDGQHRGTWVHLDGIWREQKWKAVFGAAHILRGYQEELRKGVLVGHPDFIVDFGQGERIIELTGRDKTLNPRLLVLREAVKKRQLAMYLNMMPCDRGFVLIDNKGDNHFKFLPLDRDAEEMRHLYGRVELVNGFVHHLAETPAGQRAEAFRQFVSANMCQKKHCGICPK